MNKISEYIKSIGFTFSFRRLKRAILLIILFAIIGAIVFLGYKYKNTDEWKMKKYTSEVASKFDIGDKNVINIVKKDVTLDNKADYVFICGNEVYSTDSSSNKTIEQYENVTLVLIDGKIDIPVVYDINKKFSSDVELKVCDDEQNIYFLVSDTKGNVSLCKMSSQEGPQDINSRSMDDIVANTTESFLGYTIYIDKQEESKIKVTLDNYNKPYLDEHTDETILDFSENGIDISRYRETYLRDSFSSFELKDDNNDGILEFVGYQHLLYCLDDTQNKTLGIVKTIFTIENDNKLKFSHVEISII